MEFEWDKNITNQETTSYNPLPYVKLNHPEWSKNTTIYEVNIRQYTPQGTFKAFESHLPRLHEMGVDIIWLMPVHPIGEKHRKGTLGSYYAVKDYYAVNPEFGTLQDFKILINKIHKQGMYVIIDWVANHSSPDNPLVEKHPDWYASHNGFFQSTPWYNWNDIIEFDYSQPEIRKYMTEALKYWVKETDIDGFRCDVAGFVPVDFWENARAVLDTIKPVFMLAEWESRDLVKKAFDMTYSWSLWDCIFDIVHEGKSIACLYEYFAHHQKAFPKEAYRMSFTENHDKNSWHGNQYANFGEGLHAAMVLCCTVSAMPLVYSGQEAGLSRSLAFFEKDTITWQKHENFEIYKKLFSLKHRNKALWNGINGGEMLKIENDKTEQVISFSRKKDEDKVIIIINLSNKPVSVNVNTKYHAGTYKELFSEEEISLKNNKTFALHPWNFRVFENCN